MVIVGIFLSLTGVAEILFPKVFYKMRECEKADYDSEPSAAMLWLIRISGVFSVAVAICCFIYGFI